MGFTFNNITSKEMNIKARIESFSVVPSLRNRSVQISGKDGLYDFGCELSERNIVFDCYIFPQISKARLLEIADNLAVSFDPKQGVKQLVLEDMPNRYFMARLSEGIDVQKLIQNSGSFTLNFVAYDPYGYAINDEIFELDTDGNHSITRTLGNTESLPIYELQANIPSSTDTITISTNGVSLVVNGELLEDETLVIDSSLMTAKVVDEYGVTLRNGLLLIDEYNFPSLESGDNLLSITENGTTFISLTITAQSRWR